MSTRLQHKYTINAGEVTGKINAVNGVNFGPLSMHGFLDLSEWHQQLKIPFTRVHDTPFSMADTVDIHCIFPLFDKDEHDPSNYTFAKTDDYLKSIINAGSQIYFRLGESIEHFANTKYHVHPPSDNQKWSTICINIIRHYNEGWANGFHFGIKYWEIWNEGSSGNLMGDMRSNER